jgi:sulfur-oxidizing protein SoxZ
VIRSFACRYNGESVFAVRMSSGIAANPYLRFFVTASESGTLDFEWIDDSGARGTAQSAVKVA